MKNMIKMIRHQQTTMKGDERRKNNGYDGQTDRQTDTQPSMYNLFVPAKKGLTSNKFYIKTNKVFYLTVFS